MAVEVLDELLGQELAARFERRIKVNFKFSGLPMLKDWRVVGHFEFPRFLYGPDGPGLGVRRAVVNQLDGIVGGPGPPGNASRHGRGGLEGLVLAAEIVVQRPHGEAVHMVLRLLGEGVGEADEAPHAHPHGEVAAPRVAGADQVQVAVIPTRRTARTRPLDTGSAIRTMIFTVCGK